MGAKEELLQAIAELEEEKSYTLVKKVLDEGVNPKEIIDILRKGVEIVGERFNKKEYFLTELVMSGEIFQQSAKILETAMKEGSETIESLGVVVIGTVKGDVHDIGKNIFVTLLQAAGCEVHDLGVDIPAEEFITKVKETKANIVAYSGLLTVALDSMKKTTEALKSAGLREKIKIIIGGLPVDEMWMKKAGADAYTDNAFNGVKIVTNWLREG
ncbi:Methionine synthase [subsurface metagenome]|jgi:methanogenic corrinoid protein MtbC1